MNATIDSQLSKLVPQWTSLFKELKQNIGDDYRASDNPDDNRPGMSVTIGFTPESEDKACSWSYQTGDNSFTGGAYGHPHWAVVSLYRRSNSRSLAEDCADQIGELCADLPAAEVSDNLVQLLTDQATGSPSYGDRLANLEALLAEKQRQCDALTEACRAISESVPCQSDHCRHYVLAHGKPCDVEAIRLVRAALGERRTA